MTKKLPWFPLYVYDFAQHERVIPMTYEQEGLYLALLRHEWIHGSIPADDAELRGILKPHNPDALAQVKRCFEPMRGDQSRLSNPRIEEVRREQSDLSRRFSEAGRKGGVSSGLTRRRVAEARLKGGSSHLEATPKQQSRAEQSRTEQEEQQQLPVADAPGVALVLALTPQETAVRAKTAVRQTKEQALDLAAGVVFAYWRDRHGKKRCRLDAKRERKIVAALRENDADVSELLYAIDGALKDPWLMGTATNSVKPYNDIETILRDRGQIERLCELVKHADDQHPYLSEPHAEA